MELGAVFSPLEANTRYLLSLILHGSAVRPLHADLDNAQW